MRRSPVIGLTTYARDEKNRFSLPVEYVESVRRAGGLPLLVTPGETNVDKCLGILDALVLTGGGDLEPGHYGGRTHETIYGVDADRDGTELALARAVLEARLPALCICRGTQVLNVALGGTLVEHLPDEVGESVLHRLPPREPTPHAVTVAAGSRLAGILGATEITAASWHHQAIRTPGRGLRVVAHAPDGTIEAVEHPEYPELVAVQWHPELTAADDPIQQRLFDVLVEAARGGSTGRA